MDERLKQKFYEGKSREEITELFYDMFYGALSRRVWLTYEEEGLAWLEEALRAFGADRGRELGALFEKNGREKNLSGLLLHPDFALRGKWELKQEAGGARLTVTDSPRMENMRRYGLPPCVELYVKAVYPPFFEAFSPHIRVLELRVLPDKNGAELLLAAGGGEDSARLPNTEAEEVKFDYGREYAALVKDLYDTMYGFIAGTVIRHGGAEGEQILRRGIRDFGVCRGLRLRRMQEEEGMERNLYDLMDYYDIPAVEGYHEEKEIFTPVRDICSVDTCNHFARWREKGMLKYGVMYCEEVHNAFWTAYNERIVVQQPEILTRGDGRCRFMTKIVSQDEMI